MRLTKSQFKYLEYIRSLLQEGVGDVAFFVPVHNYLLLLHRDLLAFSIVFLVSLSTSFFFLNHSPYTHQTL